MQAGARKSRGRRFFAAGLRFSGRARSVSHIHTTHQRSRCWPWYRSAGRRGQRLWGGGGGGGGRWFFRWRRSTVAFAALARVAPRSRPLSLRPRARECMRADMRVCVGRREAEAHAASNRPRCRRRPCSFRGLLRHRQRAFSRVPPSRHNSTPSTHPRSAGAPRARGPRAPATAPTGAARARLPRQTRTACRAGRRGTRGA